jgi:2-oxoglutarate ferredoxin oxidoreductase subunit beta
MRLMHETIRRGEFPTGILYLEPDKEDFIEVMNMVEEPLAFLPTEKSRPPKSVLDELMAGLR